jgi:hypothetical protein
LSKSTSHIVIADIHKVSLDGFILAFIILDLNGKGIDTSRGQAEDCDQGDCCYSVGKHDDDVADVSLLDDLSNAVVVVAVAVAVAVFAVVAVVERHSVPTNAHTHTHTTQEICRV